MSDADDEPSASRRVGEHCRAAVHGRDVTDQREAEPVPSDLAGSSRAHEGRKHPLALVGRETGPLVAHLDAELPVSFAHVELDRAGHRPAQLHDAAAGNTDVGVEAVAGGGDAGVAKDQIEGGRVHGGDLGRGEGVEQVLSTSSSTIL